MSAPVTREVLVQASPERVFAAFVDVADVLNWLADGAVIGPRPGGRWGLGWYSDPDSDEGYNTIGVLEVFEPGRRLVVGSVMFSTPEGTELGPMTISIDLTPEDGGTRVVVTQTDVPDTEAFGAGVGPGWERSLSDLKAWLEEGRKLPGR